MIKNTQNDGTPEVELSWMPYTSFSVKPNEMTVAVIDRICEHAYLHLLANPAYLFVSKQDEEVLRADVLKHGHIRLAQGETAPQDLPLTRLVNQVTGRLMHVVVLPDLEPGKLLFGFLTH